ncbi:hypothetical protein PHYPSEUDO_013992 [Phytophthora pseudosyringae]|uniref:Uncharacterized protein n=1 Tax=Phytophthora pseudosyringae TaxID=221518 RepID=A0A8T1V5B4_9STRA|nr:hypothetical protein PHYPSEUDO_013992 [Phytophthora pseudosyringae]
MSQLATCTSEERCHVSHQEAINLCSAPHFDERDDLVEKAIKCVFPGLPSHLAYVGEFCLASLVYHAPYLRTHLAAKHPLLESSLFQHPTLITELSAIVCGIDDTNNRLHATGVPPHVTTLREIKSLLAVAVKTAEHVDAARTATVKDSMGELEQRAIGAGVVTFDGLDSALKRCLDSTGISALVEWLSAGPQQATCQQHADNTLMTPSFSGGADFGDKKTPSLRMFDGRDMPTRNLQKRLSDVRYLMRMVEDEAKRTGSWSAHQSVEDAVKTFAACETIVAVPQHTTNNQKWRRGQLS